MKRISVVIPTYNEEKNIEVIYARIKELLSPLPYEWEIIFIDNCSLDASREIIAKLCSLDRHVKSIFNVRNFGFIRSTFYGLTQATGDCAALVNADMQDPPEVLLKFIKKWEAGAKIVVGIKNSSKENPVMYFLRACYYKVIRKISSIEHIEQFTGFGLYDKSFIKVLRQLDDPLPYLRGIVAELGFKIEKVYYEQNKRLYGKTHFNFYGLYDLAMLGITSYSKVVMRIATICGFILAGLSMLATFIILLLKIFYWDAFPLRTAPILMGIFFFGSVQLFFIGLVGEYILNINVRVMKRPLVIEEKRINFTPEEYISSHEIKVEEINRI